MWVTHRRSDGAPAQSLVVMLDAQPQRFARAHHSPYPVAQILKLLPGKELFIYPVGWGRTK